ncbi:alginate export family protein [Fuerstiella marisgermanici]|uniref:Alginate export domain-containing protein n=1 Tax=Fuerstiella marisgermanici TaxID=1891926 RepID=A0A1P8WAI7_9PLAN|nr:alginate export family protein [Fuerstiella marisgermanici]APZ91070.1 hypothetical protein Fuma_00656 [Fuerstiella marisgermanici]
MITRVLTIVVAVSLNSISGATVTEAADACGDVCGEGCTTSGCVGDTFNAIDWLHGERSLFDGINKKDENGWSYSVGAQLRHRYMDESDRLRPGGPGDSTYHLWRFTPNLKVSYGDTFETFVEAIDASAFGYDAPLSPLGIDENRADLLQAYVDLKIADIEGGGSVKYRYGRQLLKYGSQHLLSPLAWSNTFRNFEGHKVMYSGSDWNVDGFHLNSVNNAAGGIARPTSFDHADQSRTISGVYSTYKGMENQTLDLYWLWFQEDERVANRMGGDRHTIGARLAGNQAVKECDQVVGTWNWDFEGAWQFGKDDFLTGANQDVNAGFFSAMSGYTFNQATWSPTISGLFYWGSGDSDPADGEINTFYSLYPLGHAYWGIIDNFSGQNLLDFGITASVKPSEKLTLLAAWHAFRAAKTGDNLYNIAGAPFAMAPGERDLGTEVDLVGTYTFSKNLNTQVGYSWFFYGDAVDRSAFARPDASQFYVQTTLSF